MIHISIRYTYIIHNTKMINVIVDKHSISLLFTLTHQSRQTMHRWPFPHRIQSWSPLSCDQSNWVPVAAVDCSSSLVRLACLCWIMYLSVSVYVCDVVSSVHAIHNTECARNAIAVYFKRMQKSFWINYHRKIHRCGAVIGSELLTGTLVKCNSWYELHNIRRMLPCGMAWCSHDTALDVRW